MNVIVLLTGFLITGIIEFNVWLGKYIFVDSVEKKYKEKGKRGTFTVTNLNYDRDTGDRMISAHRIGDLYDEYGNLLQQNSTISNCGANIGDICSVEYYEFEFGKYKARVSGYREPCKLMNGLMLFFLILGLVIIIPISIF